MSHTVEVSDEGTIRIPAEVLDRVKPHTRFVVAVYNDTVVLRPERQDQSFWAPATPEEWAEDLRQ